ncbi:hypothetical protein FZEAL_9935 [Fusarium zealandicum]|uniref:Uncharacterized protein n=1 Tax=Fusarium zealandicum TaxID=1053134 RepID=A0A8H4XDC8_9HYPO|nr:hypothetical protein FZEAL_9935 [Fusarium zealandicum]
MPSQTVTCTLCSNREAHTSPDDHIQPNGIDHSMLARFIYDTSSLQDRLIQGSDPAIPTIVNRRPSAADAERYTTASK